ncbi:MAG: hypothetical protein EA397_04635 [Deltaproteobacteria bacterium]|nr:MAG: hypothetical protein EA397_04635 [Deltaproteobacteria bacterium]
MKRIRLLATREVRELLRQPAMLLAITTLFLAIGGLVLTSAGILQLIALSEAARTGTESWLPIFGLQDASLDAVAGYTLAIGAFLLLSQYLGISGVLAGHTVLHDRQCHTLPFLLLAPITRSELLLGKVLGALALPTLLFVLGQAVVMGTLAALPLTANSSSVLPTNPAWWITTLLGAPIWAIAIGLKCAIISALARDVRTAQQSVWLIMFFATLIAGYLLVQQLPAGALTQLGVAALGATFACTALFVGAKVISRDLGR